MRFLGFIILSVVSISAAARDNECAVYDMGGPHSFVVGEKVAEGLLAGILEVNDSNLRVERANGISSHSDAIPSKEVAEGKTFEARLICTQKAGFVTCSVEGRSAIGDLSKALSENCGTKPMMYRTLERKMSQICGLIGR